jgi:fumarate reductase flavoprotein subunit
MDGAALARTIAQHNDYVKAGKDPDFGKRIDKGVMLTIENGPYYAIPQWPSVHHTMGGLTITEKTEVQDFHGAVIPGLFAAGEVTGGVHGTNRLGSNARRGLLRQRYIAGQMAATGTLPDFIKGK